MRALPMLLAALALLAAGCGDGARPETAVAEDVPLVFAGTLELAGPMAHDRAGAVFVSLRPASGGMPILTRKIELGDPALPDTDGDVRRVPFRLDETHTMMEGFQAQPPFMLELRFDPDGFVDTREGLATARIPARPGASDHTARLSEPDAPAPGAR